MRIIRNLYWSSNENKLNNKKPKIMVIKTNKKIEVAKIKKVLLEQTGEEVEFRKLHFIKKENALNLLKFL